MNSTLQSAVTTIRISNYAALTTLTIVGYDYILTLSDEIEYIWNKPWTHVSTLFVLTRYSGLCFIIITTLLETSFIPGPEQTCVLIFVLHWLTTFLSGRSYLTSCIILDIFSSWAGLIFMSAADLVMILRVWALYSRSRFILGTLLTLYAIEIIPNLIWCVLMGTADGPVAVAGQVLDFSFCTVQYDPPILSTITNIVQITLGAPMCLLVVIQFIMEALQMYRATKRMHLNRYMILLARESMIYFLIMLVFSILSMLYSDTINDAQGEWWIPLFVIQYVPPFTIVPRFFLGLRALYARDLQGRRENDIDIDAAFGLSSASGRGAAVSAIVFAYGGQNERLEQGDEIEMEERAEEIRVARGSA